MYTAVYDWEMLLTFEKMGDVQNRYVNLCPPLKGFMDAL